MGSVSTVLLSTGATLDRVHAQPHESDERALVARAIVEPEAFAELYRRYLPRVHDFAYRRTGSVEAAEDICATTFESALRSLPRFRWGKGGFAPWLFRIASRQLVAHYRREGRVSTDRGQRAAAELAPGRVPAADDTIGAMGEDIEAVRAALDRLNGRYQRAIALRYLSDLDIGDAANAMGLARPAFSVVLTRAVAALRKELERSKGAGRA